MRLLLQLPSCFDRQGLYPRLRKSPGSAGEAGEGDRLHDCVEILRFQGEIGIVPGYVD